MQVTFDPDTDALYIRFKDTVIAESDEIRPGFIADVDEQNNIVGLEILDASQFLSEPGKVDFIMRPRKRANR